MTTYSMLKKARKGQLNYAVESAKQDFMMAISMAMKSKEITKAELADSISCSPAYISKILKGDENFTIETMVKIARALNTKLCIHLAENHENIQWFGVVTRNATQETEHTRRFWPASSESSMHKIRVTANA